jgi:hypothetical protein
MPQGRPIAALRLNRARCVARLGVRVPPSVAYDHETVRLSELTRQERQPPLRFPNTADRGVLISRTGDDAIRQAYTDGVLVVIDGLAARMAPHDPASARVKALSLLGLMAGTLQLARALTDRQLSDDLLEQGLRNALALVNAELGP